VRAEACPSSFEIAGVGILRRVATWPPSAAGPESDFDPDTRFALAWFEQFQFDEGKYGQAEVLATAKAISVGSLAEAGIASI